MRQDASADSNVWEQDAVAYADEGARVFAVRSDMSMARLLELKSLPPAGDMNSRLASGGWVLFALDGPQGGEHVLYHRNDQHHVLAVARYYYSDEDTIYLMMDHGTYIKFRSTFGLLMRSGYRQ